MLFTIAKTLLARRSKTAGLTDTHIQAAREMYLLARHCREVQEEKREEDRWGSTCVLETTSLRDINPVVVTRIWTSTRSDQYEAVYVGKNDDVYHQRLDGISCADDDLWQMLPIRRINPWREDEAFVVGTINPALCLFIQYAPTS